MPYKTSVTQSDNSEGRRGKAVPQEEKEKHFGITTILLFVQGGMSKNILDHG